VNTHHAYVNRELPRLAELAKKVVNRLGDKRLELPLIQAKVLELGEDMTQHQAKEELILFPHISRLEKAVQENKPKPQGCFGTVANPIAMMTREHDSAGALMAELRKLSQDFAPPVGACPIYHGFYTGLREFEQDLHQHIHLENNVLFPRTIALESAAA
jgi:regulator of cell morphogenesis and NO signaling